jgi:hypothetical protein
MIIRKSATADLRAPIRNPDKPATPLDSGFASFARAPE